MRVVVLMCVVVVLALGKAGQGADPGVGDQGAVAERLVPKKRVRPREPRKDVEEVERFVDENPDAALDMSHLKALDPELASALICTDDKPRSVTRRHTVHYSVAVPTTVDGEPGEKLDLREKVIEQTIKIPGKALYLNGVESLTTETADALASHVGELHLNGLTSLSPEVAAALTTFGGFGCLLSLDGVEALDDESASLLGRSGWALSLRGVKRLSEQAYDALVKRSAPYDSEKAVHGEAADAPMPPTVWLAEDVLIEKPIGHGPMVSVRDMPKKGTFASYTQYLTRVSGVIITIDEGALQALGVVATKTISVQEWRAITSRLSAFTHWRCTHPVMHSWKSDVVVLGGAFGGIDDLLFPVEGVVVLLLNMLETDRSNVVVLSGGNGIVVTKRDAIVKPGQAFKLAPDEVRVRLPTGEEVFMRQCGDAGPMGLGGLDF